jgi:hypothetical protein
VILVTSWHASIFENFALEYAGRMVDKARIARGVMDRKANDLFWNGSEADNLYGILTLPWLPKVVSGVTLQPDGTFGTMLAELNRLASYAAQQSGGAYQPNAVAMGIRLHNILTQTRHAQDPSLTLMKAFLESNPHITSAEAAQDLDSSATAAKMLFYEKSREGMSVVLPAPFTILPAETRAFGNRTYAFMKLGGAVSRVPASALLVSFTIS